MCAYVSLCVCAFFNMLTNDLLLSSQDLRELTAADVDRAAASDPTRALPIAQRNRLARLIKVESEYVHTHAKPRMQAVHMRKHAVALFTRTLGPLALSAVIWPHCWRGNSAAMHIANGGIWTVEVQL